MNTALTFLIKLQDMLSPGMRQAAQISNTASNQIQSQFAQIQGSGRRMSASVNELHARLNAINQVRFSTTIQREFDVATRAAQRLERQIETMENKGNKSGGGGMGLGGFIKGGLITGLISEGVGMLKEGVVDTYKTSLKSSSLRTAINSTTGGQGSEAVRQTDFLANKYGLNYEASLEGVKTLTGGLKSMNLPLQEQMKIFEGVSSGVAAMKLGAEESKGAMLALGQMASKGTVSAEELRGQLGERIPGAFGIAAKAMNMTEAELGKMMQKGEIAAKDFLPRFAAEMQKTFGADALAAANGPQAVQERFNNAIFKMKAEIGDGFMPLITPFIVKMTELAVTILPYIQTGITFISDVIKGMIDTVSTLSGGTGEWGSYISVIKEYIGAVWITVKSLLGNIWAIVSGVIQWMGKSELLKDVFWALSKVAEGLLWVIRGIGNAIQWIWENIIKPIFDAIDWVYSKVKGLFTGGKAQIEIVNATTSGAVTPMTQRDQFNSFGAPFMAGPAPYIPAGTNPITANAAGGGAGVPKMSGVGGSETKSKADSINSGGQRSVVINIHKLIEKLEQHIVGGGREAADEFGNAVREALRRELYSLNGVAVK